MEPPAIAPHPVDAVEADDRRIAPRRRMLKSARIFWHKGPLHECLVRNISETGACLQVNQPVPNAFVLMLGDITCSCRVVWRKANEIGVQLIT